MFYKFDKFEKSFLRKSLMGNLEPLWKVVNMLINPESYVINKCQKNVWVWKWRNIC